VGSQWEEEANALPDQRDRATAPRRRAPPCALRFQRSAWSWRAVIALKEPECCAPRGARTSSTTLAPASGSPAA